MSSLGSVLKPLARATALSAGRTLRDIQSALGSGRGPAGRWAVRAPPLREGSLWVGSDVPGGLTCLLLLRAGLCQARLEGQIKRLLCFGLCYKKHPETWKAGKDG